MKNFSKPIQDKLKRYVYLYIDPRNNEIFYIGKGIGNRVFTHLTEDSEKEKSKRIKEIMNDGLDPKIEILVHGIKDDKTIKKIEASVIDLVGIDKLTNIQKGYESKEYGRMSINQVYATYSAKKVVITEPSLLVNINKSFRYGLSAIELYDVTRSAWNIGDNRNRINYAFSVYQGIVQEIYEVFTWYPSNKTLKSINNGVSDSIIDNRWEFIGNIANSNIRSKYLYKDVSDYMGPRNPINYVNI